LWSRCRHRSRPLRAFTGGACAASLSASQGFAYYEPRLLVNRVPGLQRPCRRSRVVRLKYARRESAPRQSPMGLCFSAPPDLFGTLAPATSARIGGLLAEGQTPAALSDTARRCDSKVTSEVAPRPVRLSWLFVKQANRGDLAQPGGGPSSQRGRLLKTVHLP
jgi:hypothetical protein